jgi:hypothetical protein
MQFEVLPIIPNIRVFARGLYNCMSRVYEKEAWTLKHSNWERPCTAQRRWEFEAIVISFKHNTSSGVATSVMKPGRCQRINATAVPTTYRLRTLNFGQRYNTPTQSRQYKATKIKDTRLTISSILKKLMYCGKNVSKINVSLLGGRGTSHTLRRTRYTTWWKTMRPRIQSFKTSRSNWDWKKKSTASRQWYEVIALNRRVHHLKMSRVLRSGTLIHGKWILINWTKTANEIKQRWMRWVVLDS